MTKEAWTEGKIELVEQFKVPLNWANRFLDLMVVSSGGVDTVADHRVTYVVAL